MPEIPVGRIAFSISGKQYEIQAPDLVVHSSAEFVGSTFERGIERGTETERQRIRTKVAEMVAEGGPSGLTSDEIDEGWERCCCELLRWLDKEES